MVAVPVSVPVCVDIFPPVSLKGPSRPPPKKETRVSRGGIGLGGRYRPDTEDNEAEEEMERIGLSELGDEVEVRWLCSSVMAWAWARW